jgi:hypothetical protein
MYKIIEIFDLSSIANNGVLNVSALNNAFEAVGTLPLARAPDRPSSMR